MSWVFNAPGESIKQANLAEGYTVGRPKPVGKTTEKYEEMGWVGVYYELKRNPDAGSMSLAVFLVGVFGMLIAAAAVVGLWYWLG